MKRNFRIALNIRTKYLLATLILFSVFFFLNSNFWYENFSKEAKRTSVERINSVIGSSNSILESYLKDIYNIATLVSIDSVNELNTNITTLLSNPNLSNQELFTYRKSAQDFLVNLCSFKTYLYGMTISDFEGNTINYGVTLPFNDLKSMDWFSKITSMKKDSVIFITPHTSNLRDLTGNSDVISIARPVMSGNKVIGFVLADIKTDIFNDFFNLASNSGISIILLDNQSKEIILNSNQGNLSDFVADIGNYEEYLSKPNAQFYYSSKKNNVFMISSKSDFTGWTTVGAISTHSMMSNFNSIVKQSNLISFLLWFISLLIIFSISIMLTRNLQSLSTAVKRIDKDYLDIDIKITSNDEVRELYNQFRSMLTRIRMLVSEIRFTESQKRRSEIQALQAQINPHFLHNTLSTIKFLANLQGSDNISNTAENLSNMLRINMDMRTMITIKEEIDYLNNYLGIQTYRFAGNFKSQIICEENLFHYHIPKLLLQPIIENALYHGIANKKEGIILVKFYEDVSHLVVRVSDNGVGLDSIEINRILCSEASDEHIGLSNINKRIQLYFGESYGLTIDSQPGIYTYVEVTIPKILESDVDLYV